MREDIKEWLKDVQMNWQHLRWLLPRLRGVEQDRSGKRYWHFEDEWEPGHFQIGLIAWPGFTYDSSIVGWLSLAVIEDTTSWMIHDVQVSRPRNQKRGVGTALVRAAIALARRHGAHELRGFVTPNDVKASPFLPTWYAKLGFTVQLEGTAAQFWMDLAPPETPLP